MGTQFPLLASSATTSLFGLKLVPYNAYPSGAPQEAPLRKVLKVLKIASTFFSYSQIFLETMWLEAITLHPCLFQRHRDKSEIIKLKNEEMAYP